MSLPPYESPTNGPPSYDIAMERGRILTDQRFDLPRIYSDTLDCLLMNDANFTRPSQSLVATQLSPDGSIISYDSQLQDADELWKFFHTFNQPPDFTIRLTGTHKKVNSFYTTGYRQTIRKTVVDFDIEFDMSAYIDPNWKCLVIGEKNRQFSFKHVLESFTNSSHALKELNMKKTVEWDYQGLEMALCELVRWAGYVGTVTVDYHFKRDHVTAKSRFQESADQLSRILSKKDASKEGDLVMQFPTLLSASDFFDRNVNQMIEFVTRKRKVQVVAL